MIVKMIRPEWYQDFKVPSMFIASNQCNWKCEQECGLKICQNSNLAKLENIEVDVHSVIWDYLNNPITSAIVWGGLEPFEQFDDLLFFIKTFRQTYLCNDPIVIYTGFNKDEINEQIIALKKYKNIIIKYGRFIPNQKKHFDNILGVYLASPNQFAEVIS